MWLLEDTLNQVCDCLGLTSVLCVNSLLLIALLTDPKLDTTVTLDSKIVKVPQGKPVTHLAI